MKKLVIAALGALVALGAQAQSHNRPHVPAGALDDLALTIASSNPTVVSTFFDAQAEGLDIKSENRLPDPSVELEQLWGNQGAGNKFTLSVSQEFEFPTIYSRRSRAAGLVMNSADYLSAATFLDVALEAKLLLLEYVYTAQSVDITRTMQHNVDSLRSASSSAASGGELTRLDLAKLDISAIDIDTRLSDLTSRLDVIKSELQRLAGECDIDDVVSQIPHDFPDDPMLSLDAYTDLALSLDPMLQYRESQQLANQALGDVASLSRLPSFSLGYIYNKEAGVTFQGFNVGVSLPLWSRSSEKQAILSKALATEMAMSDRSVELTTTIKGEYDTATSAAALMRRYDAIPLDEDFALLDRAYATGTINLITYLDEINYFTQARLDALQSHYAYHIALCRLNRYSLLPD